MIWRLWFNLGRSYRRKKYIRSALMKAENKIWENEFLKHQIWEVRGNMREQYDWLRERVEGAIRHIAEEKWTIHYAETGDVVKVTDLPLPPREIDTLPDKASMPIRFYKRVKNNMDAQKVGELKRIIEQRQPDLDQQKKQLEGIDAKVAEIDGTITGLHELKKSLISMLNKL